MKYRVNTQEAYEQGPRSFFMKDLLFQETVENEGHFLRPAPQDGEGEVYQFSPAPGFFLSIADWKPYVPLARQYQIDRMFMEIFFVESGDITLIRNGKKALHIPEGVNVYLNSPSKGRLCYGAGIPVKYISIVLFEDYIREHIEKEFSREDFDRTEAFCWKTQNYNTTEVTLLFSQLKQKLRAFEKSRLYYESKVGELLAIVMSNFRHEKERLERSKTFISPEDQKGLERVRSAIERNPAAPPDMTQLCRLAAMGKTKLRESFKAVYQITLGGYLREVKMKQALVLLADMEPTIQAVATGLGYASAGKFSIAFKKVYGQSPEEYRASMCCSSPATCRRRL